MLFTRADELITLPQRPNSPVLGLSVYNFLPAIALQSGSLLADSVVNTRSLISRLGIGQDC